MEAWAHASHWATCEKYCTLGLFGHGGILGISKAFATHEAVNHVLMNRFATALKIQTWTSRHIQNMLGLLNHANAVGSFSGVLVWVEDEHGKSKAQLRDGIREHNGTWVNMHNTPVS